MTKKTNSLLFRYGGSTLWLNKTINDTIFSNRLRLENIIQTELKKKGLSVLKVCYDEASNLKIFVYKPLTSISVKLKKQLLLDYQRTLNLKKTRENFGLDLSTIRWLLMDTIQHKTRLRKKIETKSIRVLLILFFKKYLLKTFFDTLLLLQRVAATSVFDVKLIGLYALVVSLDNNRRARNVLITTSVFYKKGLRKTNGFLTLKLLSLQLEHAFHWSGVGFWKVSITNAFLTKGLFLRFNKSKLYSREVYRIAFQTILLSLVYRNTKVLSDYLVDLIKKNKQHHKTLRTFVSGIERFFFSNTLKLLGLQLRVTGKLGGRMRKSKYHYSLGKVQLQTIRMGVSYTLGVSYTKFGVISIKTWLLYGNADL
jgi:hypothetical protein